MIAAIVQMVEMVIDRYSPALYMALGVFLPLIAVNWRHFRRVALYGGARLHLYSKRWFSVSAPVWAGSWLLFPWLPFASRCATPIVPEGLEGFGITMIMTGLMAMGFMLFSGITL